MDARINAARLLDAYDQAREFRRTDQEMPVPMAQSFAAIEQVFEDKKTKTDALIMIYGVYNAGKSTLINALLGSEKAKTGDIPTTDAVTAYQWGSYSIWDTPGVDAPIEHENITKEMLVKADAIVFVVDPRGAAEEAQTLKVLMDLLQEGKQVFLVFNEKHELSEGDFEKLKDQLRARLQQMARARGLHEVLKDIPIITLNAKRALHGRLKGQLGLVELSGFSEFEQQLKNFLQGISPDDIYGRLKSQLTDFLQKYVILLNERSSSALVKKYDKVLNRMSVEKSRLSLSMERELARQRQNIYEKSKAAMRASAQTSSAQIEQLLQQAGGQLSESLSHELAIFFSVVHDEVDGLQMACTHIEPPATLIQMPDMQQAVQSDGEIVPSSISSAGVSAEMVQGAAMQLAAAIKPEHIVSGLQLVKNTLPSLMTGIGTKTMLSWASTAVTKAIPFIGIAVSAAQTLWSFFSENPEAEALHAKNEEFQQARERAMQQLEDFACKLADDFERSMHPIIKKEIEEFFSNVSAQVSSVREGFGAAEKANSQRLEQLVNIEQQALNA